MIEKAKFTCSPLGEVLEKQTKTIEYQGIKKIKPIEDGNQLVVSNELYLMILMPTEIVYHLKNKKNVYLINFLKKDLLNFRIFPNNLICKYKTEGINPKDFNN